MSVRRGRGCSREKWGSALLPLLLLVLQILKGTEIIIILSRPSDPHTKQQQQDETFRDGRL